MGCAAVTEVGTTGRLGASVWLPVASEMAGCARPAGSPWPCAGGGGRRRLPGGVAESARPGVAYMRGLAPVYARARLLFCNRQSAASAVRGAQTVRSSGRVATPGGRTESYGTATVILAGPTCKRPRLETGEVEAAWRSAVPNTRITAFRTSRATHIEAPYSSTRAQQAASSNVAATLRTLHICPAASQAATDYIAPLFEQGADIDTLRRYDGLRHEEETKVQEEE